MGREFIDNNGELLEVVWAGDMKIPLTGPRETRPAVDISHEPIPTTSKRKYNKTGNHTKDKGYWKPEVNKFGMSE